MSKFDNVRSTAYYDVPGGSIPATDPIKKPLRDYGISVTRAEDGRVMAQPSSRDPMGQRSVTSFEVFLLGSHEELERISMSLDALELVLERVRGPVPMTANGLNGPMNSVIIAGPQSLHEQFDTLLERQARLTGRLVEYVNELETLI